MDLILWRHCDAESGAPDLERRLTSKGAKQAERVAHWLERHLPDNCRVLVSPALRCQQTVKPLDRKFKTVPALAPGANAAAILDAANWPDARESVLIVGHQPTLGQVASFLLSGEESWWSVRKGAVWWLSNHAGEEGSGVVLKAVVSPDYL